MLGRERKGRDEARVGNRSNSKSRIFLENEELERERERENERGQLSVIVWLAPVFVVIIYEAYMLSFSF